MEPLPYLEDTRRIWHTYVSYDPRYINLGLSATDGDAECTEAPTRIPPWVLSTEETQKLFVEGHDTTPRASRVPARNKTTSTRNDAP